MNSAVRQSARPGDFKPKQGSVPNEVLGMARQMGLTPEDLKGADKYWKMLDDLHTSDPAQYDALVAHTYAVSAVEGVAPASSHVVAATPLAAGRRPRRRVQPQRVRQRLVHAGGDEDGIGARQIFG